MKRYIFLIAILVSVLQSCEKMVEFNGEQEEPKLVLNCLAQTDSSLTVHLPLSRFFLSNASFPDVNNATVLLNVNGTEMEPWQKDDKGHYVFLYKGNPGDTLTVTAKTSDGKELMAGTRIPQRPEISDGLVYPDRYTETDLDGSWTFDVHTLRFKLKDRPNERNYYRLTIRYVDTLIYRDDYYDGDSIFEDRNQYFRCSDMALIGTSGIGSIVTEGSTDFYGTVMYFSDEMIDGKTHEIVIHLDSHDDYYYNSHLSNPRYRICLESMSEDYYRYRQAVMSQENSDGLNFFAEPTTIPSNVIGGLGIFASSTKATQWIELVDGQTKGSRK